MVLGKVDIYYILKQVLSPCLSKALNYIFIHNCTYLLLYNSMFAFCLFFSKAMWSFCI